MTDKATDVRIGVTAVRAYMLIGVQRLVTDATDASRLVPRPERPRVSADPGVSLFTQRGQLVRADEWPQRAGRLMWAASRRDRGPMSCLMPARTSFGVRPRAGRRPSR